MDAFPRCAYAGATPDLVPKARAAVLGIEAERLQAQAVVIRQAAQRDQRRAARAVDAIDERQRVGVDLVRAREAQALAVEDEAARRFRPAQRAVVRRRELLHQSRLGEQRAKLADRA